MRLPGACSSHTDSTSHASLFKISAGIKSTLAKLSHNTKAFIIAGSPRSSYLVKSAAESQGKGIDG